MEHARWIDWKEKITFDKSVDRIYFGHETCQDALPSPEDAADLINHFCDGHVGFTLVTPFLTHAGMETVHKVISRMSDELNRFEVVCNDWGLLMELSVRKECTPVVGRLLSGQFTDPRFQRILSPGGNSSESRTVTHVDGTVCTLKRRSPSDALEKHYKGCSLDRVDVISLLRSFGANRCEISNTLQGIEIRHTPGFFYSLYIPEVLLSVMRKCPGKKEDMSTLPACSFSKCREEVSWRCLGFPVDVVRRGNGLYYKNPNMPSNMELLPIDRVVHLEFT